MQQIAYGIYRVPYTHVQAIRALGYRMMFPSADKLRKNPDDARIRYVFRHVGAVPANTVLSLSESDHAMKNVPPRVVIEHGVEFFLLFLSAEV